MVYEGVSEKQAAYAEAVHPKLIRGCERVFEESRASSTPEEIAEGEMVMEAIKALTDARTILDLYSVNSDEMMGIFAIALGDKDHEFRVGRSATAAARSLLA